MTPDGSTALDLVDVHAHFLTDEYVTAATAAGHEHPDGMPGWPDWSPERQLADMDRNHIRTAVLSISSPGVHFGDDTAAIAMAEHVNDTAASLVRAHPGRFGSFASVPLPDVDGAVRETVRALDVLGATGITVESNAHGQYLGDAALEPLWDVLDQRQAIVFMHPTSPTSWRSTALGRPRPMLEFMFDSTRSIVDLIFAGVLDRHPDIRVVVPHSGATLPFLSDRIGMFQRVVAPESTPWVDAVRRLWFDTAGTPFPTDVPVLAGIAGTDHLLYGSDSCWTPAPMVDAQLATIDDAPQPTETISWRALTTHNAQELFGRG